MKSRANFAVLSIPFMTVRLAYELLNVFDKKLLNSRDSAIACAAMAILMEIFILTLFFIVEFCVPQWPASNDEGVRF